MESNKKLEELRKTLPRGSYTEIANRSGLSVRTVVNVIEGKKCALHSIMKVVGEADKLLAEYKEVIGE